MKIVCILGSPNPNGSTHALVSQMLRPFEAQGLKTRLHHLNSLQIGYCRGCKSCEITGNCVQNDDAARVAEDILCANLVIVASPSYWGDVTGQLKVFIDRCTPFCNTSPARLPISSVPKGVAVAVRAGGNVEENLSLVHTIEHFLGHLDIPLMAHFTAEGINTPEDLQERPALLKSAHAFGKQLLQRLA